MVESNHLTWLALSLIVELKTLICCSMKFLMGPACKNERSLCTLMGALSYTGSMTIMREYCSVSRKASATFFV